MMGLGWLRSGRRVPYDAVRIALGLLLLVAAALKGYQLATEPLLAPHLDGPWWATGLTALLASRWLLLGAVEFELFFGLWLLAGLYPRQTRAAAIGCFALFAAVSLLKALSGAASCGCFGKVAVNPWYTFVSDCGVIFVLTRCRSPGTTSEQPLGSRGIRAVAVCLVFASCGLPAAIVIAEHGHSATQTDEGLTRRAGFIILRPEQWIGRPLPILRYLDVGEQMRQGRWTLLLHRHDCDRCRKVVPRYLERFPRGLLDRDAERLALVEIPPFGGSSHVVTSESVHRLVGRLSDSEQWFVETPVEIRLSDARVVAVLEPGRGEHEVPRLPDSTHNDTPTARTAALAPTRKDCGPACLYLCCRLAGIACSWESVKAAISPSESIASMLAIKRAAEHFGFRVEGCQVTWDGLHDEIRARHTYAILHVSGNHFVCVAGEGHGKRLRVADPGLGFAEYAEDAFLAAYRWRGASLLLVPPSRPERRIP